MDELCAHCDKDYYDPERFNTCYACYLTRRGEYLECIWCGRWHSPKYNTCFQCRSQHPERDEAGLNLRLEIKLRDEFTCRYCHATEGAMEVDHIKPCAVGGTADPWNLQVLCSDCNRWKSSSWSVGSRHWHKRVDLMRYYLVFLWRYLTVEQRQLLLAEAAELEQYGADLLRHRLGPFESPVCSDCDTGSDSTSGTCVMCRREISDDSGKAAAA